MKEPKTYWESRSLLMENALTTAIYIIKDTLPPAYQQGIADLGTEWDEELEKLDKEYGEE